jgi:hypothetical protein
MGWVRRLQMHLVAGWRRARRSLSHYPKERIREMMSRTRGISLPKMVSKTATYLRGWLAYLGDAKRLQCCKTWNNGCGRRLRSVV